MSKFQNIRTAVAKFIAGKSLANDWLRGEVGSGSNGAQLISPYSQSTWIYVAISVIADAVTQVPFKICRMSADGGSEDVITSGPVVDLFTNPHPTLKRALFWQTIVSWEALRGEFFIVALDGAGNVVPVIGSPGGRALPKTLLPLNPDFLWHMVQGYDLAGWRFTGAPMSGPLESQVLLPEEIIHSRTFNPYLFWRGMSPLSLALLPASSDFAAAQFMKGLMMNNADTGVIVTTDQQVDEVQREAIMAALRERKRKAGTPDRPLFLWGGAKVEKPSVSSADMQFLENRKLNRQEIGSIYKVPESMMGFSDQKSSMGGGQAQNAEEIRFIGNTVVPVCRRLEDAVRPIVKAFDPSFDCYFDIDSLPIMQEARQDRADTATKYFGMGVPFNKINENLDLGFEPIEGGDVGYIAFALQPVGEAGKASESVSGSVGESGNEGGTMEGKDVRDASGAIKKLMGLIGKDADKAVRAPHVCAGNPAYEAAIKGAVKRTQGKMQKFFFQQRGRVLSKLENSLAKAAKVATKAVDELFDMPDENDKLRTLMAPLLRADLEFGGAQLFEEINAEDFALAPQDAIDYLSARANVIEGVNQTTWDAIKSAVSDGLGAGEGYDAIAKRIKDVYSAATDSRAEMIAVTETNAAVNAGRFNAMNQAKVPMKAWQTSHLENTRPSHIACEDQGPIPTDGVFVNGLRFPGDPKGAAGEVINCRCFSYAVLDGGKSLAKDAKGAKFLSWETWAQRSVKTTN